MYDAYFFRYLKESATLSVCNEPVLQVHGSMEQTQKVAGIYGKMCFNLLFQ